jgi:hypothetical protein
MIRNPADLFTIYLSAVYDAQPCTNRAALLALAE